MLKASIALVAICASTVAAAFWIQSGVRPTKSPVPGLTMPSLEELHLRAHVDNLPVQEVKEPF
jgi:hypothetical protein